MSGRDRIRIVFAMVMIFSFVCFHSSSFASAEDSPPVPEFYLNGQPAVLTVQDLSGLGTRPLRLLVQRNNRAHGDELFQVYALGIKEGDDLRVDLADPLPGVRVTLYKILHEPDGSRFLNMPLSIYLDETRKTTFQEKVGPFREEFLIAVFEKTDSPNEKNVNVRYFEERVRKLSIAAYKTNFMFSSLKLKMKDLGQNEIGKFFERDVQLLVARLVNPRRVFLFRLWKADHPK